MKKSEYDYKQGKKENLFDVSIEYRYRVHRKRQFCFKMKKNQLHFITKIYK